jgi:hypothetical protein
MGLVRVPRDHCALHACHARRGVTARSDRLGIVKFDNLPVVHICAETPRRTGRRPEAWESAIVRLAETQISRYRHLAEELKRQSVRDSEQQ